MQRPNPGIIWILGDPARFLDGKAVASYVGLIPSEFSSGGQRQQLGRLTKQGSPMLRFLWCEAVGHAVRKDDRLYSKGYIFDPKNKSRSLLMTEEGVARSKELFQRYFGKSA